jgi:hypothetical protein
MHVDRHGLAVIRVSWGGSGTLPCSSPLHGLAGRVEGTARSAQRSAGVGRGRCHTLAAGGVGHELAGADGGAVHRVGLVCARVHLEGAPVRHAAAAACTSNTCITAVSVPLVAFPGSQQGMDVTHLRMHEQAL